jgi:flagellar biosynthesis chaperone FliJ
LLSEVIITKSSNKTESFGGVLMDKTIIVGVGGTGLEVIRQLRKYIVENSTDMDGESKLKLSYLYIDTDPDEIKKNDDNKLRWEVMGKSIALNESEYFLIQCPEVGTIVKNISSYQDINEWFPTNELKTIDQTSNDTPGARQIRPLGRFSFYFEREKIKTACLNAYSKISTGTGKTQIYLCCSISGGTGAGIFLDLAYSLREWIPDCSIYGFLVMPDMMADRGDRYPSNAYAALLELNYANLNKVNYKGEEIEISYRPAGSTVSHKEGPFDNCYLIGNKNSAGMEMKLDAIPAMIAHRIYLNFDSSFASAAQSLLNNGSFERSRYLRDPNCDNVHSQNFFSFGLSTIKYPIDKITDILSYKIGDNLLNAWIEEVTVPGNMNELVKNELMVICLSDDYIYGDKDLFGNKDFPSPKDEIQAFVNNLILKYSDVRIVNRVNPMSLEISNYPSNYRGVGIIKFYKNKLDDVNGAAAEIMKKVKGYISNYMMDRDKGMHFCYSFLDILKDYVSKKKLEVSSNAEGLSDLVKNKQKSLNVLYANITNSESKLISKEKAIKNALSNIRDQLIEFLNSSVNVERYAYANNLLSALETSITNYRNDLTEWENNIKVLREEINEEASKRVDYLNSLSKSNSTFNGIVVFNNDILDNAISKKDMKNAIKYVEDKLISGNNDLINTFSKYNEDKDKKLKKLKEIYRLSLEWLEINKIVEANVVDKLIEIYEGKQDRRNIINNAYRRSEPYLIFDKTETHLGKGTTAEWEDSPTKKIKIVGLIMDNNNESRSSSTVKEDITTATNIQYKDIKPINDKNQILFLQEVTAFPLRLINDMKILKNKYTEHYSKREPIPLHICKNFYPPLQELFLLNDEERQKLRETKQAFVVAWVNGKLTTRISPKTNKNEIKYDYTTAGVKKLIILGEDWQKSFDNYFQENSEEYVLARELLMNDWKALKNTFKNYELKKRFATELSKLINTLEGELKEGKDDPFYQFIGGIVVSIYEDLKIDPNSDPDSSQSLKNTDTSSENKRNEYVRGKLQDNKVEINELERCFLDNILVIIKATNGQINSQVEESKELQCQMFSINEARANELLEEAVKKYHNIDKVASLAKIMCEAGGISSQKREQLLKSANILGLSEAEVDEILDNISKAKTPKNVVRFDNSL